MSRCVAGVPETFIHNKVSTIIHVWRNFCSDSLHMSCPGFDPNRALTTSAVLDNLDEPGAELGVSDPLGTMTTLPKLDANDDLELGEEEEHDPILPGSAAAGRHPSDSG